MAEKIWRFRPYIGTQTDGAQADTHTKLPSSPSHDTRARALERQQVQRNGGAPQHRLPHAQPERGALGGEHAAAGEQRQQHEAEGGVDRAAGGGCTSVRGWGGARGYARREGVYGEARRALLWLAHPALCCSHRRGWYLAVTAPGKPSL